MNKILKGLFYIWELPQNIVGKILYLKLRKNIKRASYKNSNVFYVYDTDLKGAVSLGRYIFIFSDYPNVKRIIKHEYGHSIQSRILGPLYLLVIGLPSITWNTMFKKYRRKHNISYYSFFTEK